MDKLWKRLIDTVKEWLRKRELHVRQERRMVQDRRGRWGLLNGNALGVAQGMNP